MENNALLIAILGFLGALLGTLSAWLGREKLIIVRHEDMPPAPHPAKPSTPRTSPSPVPAPSAQSRETRGRRGVAILGLLLGMVMLFSAFYLFPKRRRLPAHSAPPSTTRPLSPHSGFTSTKPMSGEQTSVSTSRPKAKSVYVRNRTNEKVGFLVEAYYDDQAQRKTASIPGTVLVAGQNIYVRHANVPIRATRVDYILVWNDKRRKMKTSLEDLHRDGDLVIDILPRDLK